jgi:hypothetical protein
MNTRIRTSKKGQSMVEFALILPILLLIVLMIVDFGRVIYYYTTLYNAAREGARYGVVNRNDYSGMRAATERLIIGLDIPVDELDIETTQGENPLKFAQVQIVYEFFPVTPLVGNLIGTPSGSITITAVAKMNAEW